MDDVGNTGRNWHWRNALEVNLSEERNTLKRMIKILEERLSQLKLELGRVEKELYTEEKK